MSRATRIKNSRRNGRSESNSNKENKTGQKSPIHQQLTEQGWKELHEQVEIKRLKEEWAKHPDSVILACPKCRKPPIGSEPILTSIGPHEYTLSCHNCDYEVKSPFKESAIRQWNEESIDTENSGRYRTWKEKHPMRNLLWNFWVVIFLLILGLLIMAR